MPSTTKALPDAGKVIHRRRAAERHHRIDQILGAAHKVFIARGYDQASVREIALEAELTTGAIYVYFKGKGELYGRILNRILDIELDYLKKAADVKGPVFKKLEAIAMAHLAFDTEFPDESNLLAIDFDKLDVPEALKKSLDDKVVESLALISNVFAEGIQQGVFPATLDKNEAAFLLYSATEGLLYTTMYDYSPEFDFTPADLVNKVVRYLIAGMTAG